MGVSAPCKDITILYVPRALFNNLLHLGFTTCAYFQRQAQKVKLNGCGVETSTTGDLKTC